MKPPRAGAALALLGLAAIAGCSTNLEAAPQDRLRKPAASADSNQLCVTRGAAKIGARVTQPTMRAVVPGSRGDAAALEFVFRGDTETSAALATSGARRQLGLKLRAANGCNLVYVMWRLDPAPQLEVSVKLNPGDKDHGDCGANGYRKLKPTKPFELPALEVDARYTLRAAISGDDLTAWINNQVVWRGTLPKEARSLTGPAGIRSDNVAFDLVALTAAPGDRARPPGCSADDGD
ncbi:MAG: hypothetical protein AB7O24_13760 [Kofleriaceae bacterium]